MTDEQRRTIEAMTDEQLVRFSRVLKLTKAVHEYDDECAFVASELARRLDIRLKASE